MFLSPVRCCWLLLALNIFWSLLIHLYASEICVTSIYLLNQYLFLFISEPMRPSGMGFSCCVKYFLVDYFVSSLFGLLIFGRISRFNFIDKCNHPIHNEIFSKSYTKEAQNIKVIFKLLSRRRRNDNVMADIKKNRPKNEQHVTVIISDS